MIIIIIIIIMIMIITILIILIIIMIIVIIIMIMIIIMTIVIIMIIIMVIIIMIIIKIIIIMIDLLIVLCCHEIIYLLFVLWCHDKTDLLNVLWCLEIIYLLIVLWFHEIIDYGLRCEILLFCRYPVVVQCFSLNSGTGGRGKYHGGDGVIREMLFRKKLLLSILTERRVYQPYGVNGESATLHVLYSQSAGSTSLMASMVSQLPCMYYTHRAQGLPALWRQWWVSYPACTILTERRVYQPYGVNGESATLHVLYSQSAGSTSLMASMVSQLPCMYYTHRAQGLPALWRQWWVSYPACTILTERRVYQPYGVNGESASLHVLYSQSAGSTSLMASMVSQLPCMYYTHRAQGLPALWRQWWVSYPACTILTERRVYQPYGVNGESATLHVLYSQSAGSTSLMASMVSQLPCMYYTHRAQGLPALWRQWWVSYPACTILTERRVYQPYGVNGESATLHVLSSQSAGSTSLMASMVNQLPCMSYHHRAQGLPALWRQPYTTSSLKVAKCHITIRGLLIVGRIQRRCPRQWMNSSSGRKCQNSQNTALQKNLQIGSHAFSRKRLIKSGITSLTALTSTWK